ncbi:tyrosine-type recombinase/integrase [Paludibacterium sp.]|uniref:tyrosine-type recombinase/integrase n=1 Tax=Paludibacterium sp. TaxID=1917523 RepID=UPI0025FEEF04|nr:tyrosine-type recombinase/integrase [Paludibacterium sp.]MBV8647861.1 tyrosine-type recombinase/integrase [Paludibacterium sp.]
MHGNALIVQNSQEQISSTYGKQECLLEMLRHPDGLTIERATLATGWQPHSIRGVLSVFKNKLGLNIASIKNTEGKRVYKEIRAPLHDQTTISVDMNSVGGRFGGLHRRREGYALPQIIQGGNSASYTVADAVQDYLRHYAKEGKGLPVMSNIVNAHILPKLGNIQVHELTTKQISEWHQEISRTPLRLRTKKGAPEQNMQAWSDDPEFIRRRRVTANRNLNVLKAALNYVWREGSVASDLAWRRVRAFRNVEAPVIRYLDEKECVRLIKACEPDLRLIVQASLFTGCRYGEICRLVAEDYRPDTGTLYIRLTKNGKPRHVVLTDEAKKFFETVTKNKSRTEHIFLTKVSKPWGKSLQSRRIHDACTRAAIDPPITYHVLRHTHASLLAMKGVPLIVIAKQLGHSNTIITEKHYAHISPGYVAQAIRENFPTLDAI